MSRREQLNVGELYLIGTATHEPTPLIRDKYSHVLLCKGSVLPATHGYIKGCILLNSIDGCLYTNIGTELLSDFQITSTAQVAMGGIFTL
jgi:hypothetical protein